MNIRVISKNVGLALLVSALFMFLSMLVSVFNGMDSAFAPLAISFIITFIFGAFPFVFVRESVAISVSDGFLIVVLSWLLSFIFGMLPYVLWGGEFTITNAWFESVSGYTTTGATILNDIEALPKGLLFWRSSTHFIGGLGVVVFLLLVLPSASPFRLKLSKLELSSLSREGYRSRSMKTVRIIVSVYLGITIFSTLTFWILGMSFFDAVNHAFSVVSTGGFSTKNLSVSHFGSTAINYAVAFYMLAASLHFGLVYSVIITRSVKPLVKNPVFRYYIASILVMSLLIMFSLKLQGNCDSWFKAASDSFLQVCCYVTTTGFGIVDNASWPFMCGIVLLFASLQCGCSGSTVGGMKADRLYIVFQTLARQIRSGLHPSSVSKIRAGGHYLTDSEALPVLLYVILYCSIMIIGILLLTLCGVDVLPAVSGTVALMGNVGPGLGELGSFGNFASQPAVAKFIYSILMILGRLEIYPVLAVFTFIFKRRH